MSMAICCFVAGLWALAVGRLSWAGVAFAAATLSHVMALPLSLIALAAARVKRAGVWLIFAGVIVAGFALFADAGSSLWLGLFNVAARWRFNGSIFEVLANLFDDPPLRSFAGVWLADARAKCVVAAAYAAVCAWVWWRRYEPARASLAVAGALLLLSPTVHPWYVTWLVALTCLELRAAWVVWSGTVLLSYAGVSTWWEYAPVFAFLIWETLPSTIAARWLQQKL